MAKIVIFLSILALIITIAFAYDPSPLQDLCVADLTSTVRVNGMPCVDPTKVEADDFFFSGLHLPANTSFATGAAVKPVTVNQVPGLNTLGLAIARIDYVPNGFFAPHYHTRASEVHIVLEGSMEVGFVTSSPTFRHYSKVLRKGDLFAVPIGLIHTQRNVGAGNLVTIVALNTQNPDTSVIPNAVFGPKIDSGYLARAFALDKTIVEELQRKF